MLRMKIESLMFCYCSCIGSNSISHGERAIIHHRTRKIFYRSHDLQQSADKKLTFFCTRRAFVVYYLQLFHKPLFLNAHHFFFAGSDSMLGIFASYCLLFCLSLKQNRKPIFTAATSNIWENNALIQVHNSHLLGIAPHLLGIAPKAMRVISNKRLQKCCTINSCQEHCIIAWKLVEYWICVHHWLTCIAFVHHQIHKNLKWHVFWRLQHLRRAHALFVA